MGKTILLLYSGDILRPISRCKLCNDQNLFQYAENMVRIAIISLRIKQLQIV